MGKTAKPPVARPFTKWAGGKGRLVPEILKRVPAQIDTYIEPFVGGGAVFFALAAEPVRRYKHAVLCDANRELIDCYRAIRNDVEGVIRALRRHRYNKRAYYRVRDQNPARWTRARRAARFLFLNRAGYNGLYRVNAAGKFNVPFGRYTNPTLCDAANLRACSRALEGVRLCCVDFEFAFADVVIPHDASGFFWYADPPYVPVSTTSDFTAYTKGGFSWNDHERLAALARSAIASGAGVLLSNADTPAVRKLYRGDFRCARVLVRRAINSKADGRGHVGELLISPKLRAQDAKRRAA